MGGEGGGMRASSHMYRNTMESNCKDFVKVQTWREQHFQFIYSMSAWSL